MCVREREREEKRREERENMFILIHACVCVLCINTTSIRAMSSPCVLCPLCIELGHFLQPCEGDLVCKCTNEKIPYFNAPIYLENKSQVGKVDDIFGPINDFVSTGL